MKALVTGATGFVGGHLVDRLLRRGDTVTALVRSRERAAPLEELGVQLVVGDLANQSALAAAVDDQDVVYHAAAILGASHEAEMLAANRDGTARVGHAAAAQAVPPRVVLISSMAAGGPATRGVPKTSAGDDHPVTGYGRSKLAAEHALTGIAVPWVILRPPVVYGPADREGFLPLFKAVKHGIAPMFGDGSMEVSVIHVDDLADAIVIAGTAAGLECQLFYVCNPEIVTGADIVRAIARVMHRSPVPVHLPRALARAALAATGAWATLFHRKSILHPDKIHEFYQDAWTADPSLFMAATGWKPQHNLERGLRNTEQWYRTNRWI